MSYDMEDTLDDLEGRDEQGSGMPTMAEMRKKTDNSFNILFKNGLNKENENTKRIPKWMDIELCGLLWDFEFIDLATNPITYSLRVTSKSFDTAPSKLLDCSFYVAQFKSKGKKSTKFRAIFDKERSKILIPITPCHYTVTVKFELTSVRMTNETMENIMTCTNTGITFPFGNITLICSNERFIKVHSRYLERIKECLQAKEMIENGETTYKIENTSFEDAYDIIGGICHRWTFEPKRFKELEKINEQIRRNLSKTLVNCDVNTMRMSTNGNDNTMDEDITQGKSSICWDQGKQTGTIELYFEEEQKMLISTIGIGLFKFGIAYEKEFACSSHYRLAVEIIDILRPPTVNTVITYCDDQNRNEIYEHEFSQWRHRFTIPGFEPKHITIRLSIYEKKKQSDGGTWAVPDYVQWPFSDYKIPFKNKQFYVNKKYLTRCPGKLSRLFTDPKILKNTYCKYKDLYDLLGIFYHGWKLNPARIAYLGNIAKLFNVVLPKQEDEEEEEEEDEEDEEEEEDESNADEPAQQQDGNS